MPESVSFFSPLDPQAQQKKYDIERRMQLAEALKKAGEMKETQMVGGIAVPQSGWEQGARALSTALGGYQEGQVKRETAEMQAEQLAKMLSAFTGGQAGMDQGGGSSGGMLPGVPPEQIAQMLMMPGGMDALVKVAADNYKSTDLMKNDRYQAISPPARRSLTMSEGAKNVGVSGGMPSVDDQGRMTIAPIPGAANTMAGFTKAQEGAKADLDMVEVDTAEGRKLMTRAQAAQLANPQGPSPYPQGAMEPSPFPPGFQNGSPSDIPPDASQFPQTTVSDVNAMMPKHLQNVASNGAPMPQRSLEDVMLDLQNGQTAAPRGPNLPGIPLKSQAQKDAQANTTDANKAFNEDFIKNGYRPVMDAAAGARKNNAEISAMRSLDITGKTGWGTELASKGANVLAGLGIAPEEAKQLASDAQSFNSILQRQVWSILEQQNGVQTEGDAQRARDTQAQLGNTPQANEFTMDLGTALNNQRIKQAQYYTQNRDQYPSNPAELEGAWMQEAPSIWDDPVMKKWANGGPQSKVVDWADLP